ncbi:phospholipase D-like domain-containing protein [Hydrocarboniphaga effusa]|uniref:phospholipase D-like domain-containing protein n=2 Tax=Nevskiaceae TaxID=568386 RepID=UPI000A005C12|nr:phospholipase D-like domain-containing protein [Hydrocarboniphaga effusa]MDZ4080467.1 phospholipase D-like domain-containing protein [Hydrocarboniphaga sp.]
MQQSLAIGRTTIVNIQLRSTIRPKPYAMPLPSFKVHFGGPDRPGALRDLLSARVAATPVSGSIDWVTYYFRDRPLAGDLASARARGVQVAVTMEARPRATQANRAVIDRLSPPEALGAGLRPLQMFKQRLHEKIYCFSHPVPTAFVGSFNPSADSPEEFPDIVSEIGDHRVAHNLLVEIRDPRLVHCLLEHARSLHRNGPWLPLGLGPRAVRDCDIGDTQLHFWPRFGAHPVERLLKRYGAGSRVRIAASHISNRASVACLRRLARRGANIEIAAEHTERRVPRAVELQLAREGIAFTRLGADANVPMHLKFVLLENSEGRHAVFGSFNWTAQAYWLNHELAVITRDDDVFEALDRHWTTLRQPSPERGQP